MIGVVATLTIQPGKDKEFEAFFLELAAQVKANEPGNLMYQLTKSRTEANVYKVLELYSDQDALAAHGKTECFRAAGKGFAAVLGGAPVVEYLDAVS